MSLSKTTVMWTHKAKKITLDGQEHVFHDGSIVTMYLLCMLARTSSPCGYSNG